MRCHKSQDFVAVCHLRDGALKGAVLKEEAEAFLTDVVGDTLAQAIGSIDDATSQFGKEVVQTVWGIAWGLASAWSSDLQVKPTDDLQSFALSLGAVNAVL